MPLQQIEPRRLYRQIADQLRRLIENGEFPVGSRLPPERDLAVQLGVSRPSVREALIALEVEGLVEVRMGSGIYACPPERARAASVMAPPPLDVIRARQTIEGEMAANAARHATPALLAALAEAIAMMEAEAGAGQIPVRGDRLFHLRITEVSGNAVLQRLVAELFDERHNPLFARFGSHFENETSWHAAIAEHRAVVAAIASGSPEAAREAMCRHLEASHGRFYAAWPASAAMPGTADAGAAPPAAPAIARRKPRKLAEES
ncbi:FadR/GntR family transcriptional regulator [Cupriavidus basilensis]|uniref:FadR/GntR family transcriptional regulator n=2 Tax=Cupriavidus basilensis TaxID=68895 RepID=A0ABT6AIB6_9BURK|nr:FadR/GntR family transcriptional regulator [Cupriavidus basilensis]MDF3832358.1 FadR/GntR family transcriptional regulator [Cupriavidus basilensis]